MSVVEVDGDALGNAAPRRFGPGMCALAPLHGDGVVVVGVDVGVGVVAVVGTPVVGDGSPVVGVVAVDGVVAARSTAAREWTT